MTNIRDSRFDCHVFFDEKDEKDGNVEFIDIIDNSSRGEKKRVGEKAFNEAFGPKFLASLGAMKRNGKHPATVHFEWKDSRQLNCSIRFCEDDDYYPADVELPEITRDIYEKLIDEDLD